MTSFTRDFYEVFLAELPYRVPGTTDFESLKIALQFNIQQTTPTQISHNVYKVELGYQIMYWIGDHDADRVDIIVDTYTRGNFQQVVYTAKNPDIQTGQPPYASDLYIKIKDDVGNKHLTFTSGDIISPEAEALWAKIVKYGGEVSVFDTKNNIYVLQHITNPEDLQQYVGDVDKSRYIFTLSENREYQLGLANHIDLMEIRRISLIPLFEYFKQ